MDYKKQVSVIENYFKTHETEVEDFKIGIEFEHYVIDRDTFETISYYGDKGVAETLKQLEKLGWKATYEGEYILGLKKGRRTITLEPGSQLELSIDANISIKTIQDEYEKFIEEINPVLREKNQELITTGYHPETKIEDITLLPMGRYSLMFDYFKDKGKYAHNMMKGTSALQVSIDYSSEDDYKKKYRLANALSPVLYALFDNSFYFEGEKWDHYNLRADIWNNCDDQRSGIAEGALDGNFGYKDYAEYILNRPPIFIKKDGEDIATGEKKVRELFNPEDYTVKELEHFLSMFFPDVRTKGFIEIRQMDSVPYNLSLAAVALIKGIFYNEENLNTAYEATLDIGLKDVEKAKLDIIERGMKATLKDKSIVEIGKWLVDLAKSGLEEDELAYIEPLEEMIEKGENPYEKIKQNENLGKKKALDWSIVRERGVI